MKIASEEFRVDTDVFVSNVTFPVKICGSHCVRICCYIELKQKLCKVNSIVFNNMSVAF